MLIVYATMQKDYAMENNYRKLNKYFDKDKLENQIVIMNEEYFLKNIDDFGKMHVILITNSNISRSVDVETYKSIKDIANNQYYKNKELYVIGDYKLLQESLIYADKIITNIVEDNLSSAIKYFPTIDSNIWYLTKIKEETPKINKLVYRK